MRRSLWILFLSFCFSLSLKADEMRFFMIDVGTGLSIYLEIPNPQGDRPFRIIYDAGDKPDDLYNFITAKPVSLKPKEGRGAGDVIDYFFLSHPHADHFKGSKRVFENFDVRHVVESKMIHGQFYLRDFKLPAINNLFDARKRGIKDAHIYNVALPYPNNFDIPRNGNEDYNEYDIAAAHLPEFLKGRRSFKTDYGKGEVTFPFEPSEVAQSVRYPLDLLFGKHTKLREGVESDRKTVDIQVIPIGTQFKLSKDADITVLHGDFVAALNPEEESNAVYKEAEPYFIGEDLNDASVAIQVRYKEAKFLIAGDIEGRESKPSSRGLSIQKLVGRYTKKSVLEYLNLFDKDPETKIPLLPGYQNYIASSDALLKAMETAFVSYVHFNPKEFKFKPKGGKEVTFAEKKFHDAFTLPELPAFEAFPWQTTSRQGILDLYNLTKENNKTNSRYRTRFGSWAKGNKPRLVCDLAERDCKLNMKDETWNVINLMQVANRQYSVAPSLANILAGFVLTYPRFLNYIAPTPGEDYALRDWADRSEKHIIDVAEQIEMETDGKHDVLKSDVLVLGHHGSFTSSSYGFVKAVNPNVGLISADDKSFSGSSLPDFQTLFWNLNTYHPHAGKSIHSLFFQRDASNFASQGGDKRALRRNLYSNAASDIFLRRGRRALPLWRTDWNDDLTNSNTLTDNVEIKTNGSPVWDWASTWKPSRIRALIAKNPHPNRFLYYDNALIREFDKESGFVRPEDPSGMMRTFSTEVENFGGEAPGAGSWNTLPLSRKTPSARWGQKAVEFAGDMYVWGGYGLSSGLMDGKPGNRFLFDGRVLSDKAWDKFPVSRAPAPRRAHVLHARKDGLVVWGGINATDFADWPMLGDMAKLVRKGGIFNPKTRRWSQISDKGLPKGLNYPTAVFSEEELFVFGHGKTKALGARYSFQSKKWSPLTEKSDDNAPSNRRAHTAVWTGSDMIIWGGKFEKGDSYEFLSNGAIYNAETKSWRPMNPNGPSKRAYHSATWTGKKMIVWGGFTDGETHLGDGGIYDPESDTWDILEETPLLSPREHHTATWTGNKLIIWGGYNGGWVNSEPFLGAIHYLGDGAVFDPKTKSWDKLSQVYSPSARAFHSAVWLKEKKELVIWGGLNGHGPLESGGVFRF